MTLLRETNLMKKTAPLLALFLVTSFPMSRAGTKEEVIRLQSDVLQLQNQVLTLQKSFDSNSGTTQSLLEQLNDQFGTANRVLAEIVNVFKGQKEDIDSVVKTLRTDLQGINVKLDETNNRLAALHKKVEERQMRVDSRQLPSASDPGGPKADQIYSLAFTDYLAGNYELAINGFQDFLITYPESEYSDNAAYYKGLSHQQLGSTEVAVQAFDEVINLFPNSDMISAAYYKKALAEQELLKHEEAIETFKKLVALFPESQEGKQALLELENLGIDVSKLSRRR